MQERHEREQYFFDDATVETIADMLQPLGRACVLCAPKLGIELERRGCNPVVLDVDQRFGGLVGYCWWDITRPTFVAEKFDVIFADPPFFNVSLSQLFTAVRMLSHHDFTQRLMIGYLTRRTNALLGTFAPFGLQATGFRPGYETVDNADRNEIEIFSNFELPTMRPDAKRDGR